MKQSVRDVFAEFSTRFEGRVPFMYLDVKGLVTTGIGNLIDPISLAITLPWMRKDGTPATKAEIESEWRKVKALQSMRMRGGMAYGAVTNLRLNETAIDGLVTAKAAEMEANLVKRFPDFASWPADAQLGLLSMAWAMGPAFRFPKFQAACLAMDFRKAAEECKMNEVGNPGLAPRNVANKQLFLNAARVLELGDRETLHYPKVVS